MVKWKQPPLIKIYEALGAVADGRIEVSGNTAKVFSSSGNKFYDVIYDPAKNAIMANDNGSYWKGYIGYPAIAFLFKANILKYDESIGLLLKGIPWKDINQKFKNDFEKTIEYIFSTFSNEQKQALQTHAQETGEHIASLNLEMLGKRQLPPEGY